MHKKNHIKHNIAFLKTASVLQKAGLNRVDLLSKLLKININRVVYTLINSDSKINKDKYFFLKRMSKISDIENMFLREPMTLIEKSILIEVAKHGHEGVEIKDIVTVLTEQNETTKALYYRALNKLITDNKNMFFVKHSYVKKRFIKKLVVNKSFFYQKYKHIDNK